MDIPTGITRLQTELARVRTALGFANDAAVDAAIASLATIEASTTKLRTVLDALKKAQENVSTADEGTP